MLYYRQFLARVVFFVALFLFLDNAVHFAPMPLNALNVSPSSRLLKTIDSPTVYYVNQYGWKLAVPSAKVFLSYNARWEDVEAVDAKELDFYKDAKYIKLINDSRIFGLKDGEKRYITQEAASALKIVPEEIIIVNRTEFSAYKTGQVLAKDEAVIIEEEAVSAESEDVQNEICVASEQAGGEDGCHFFNAVKNKDLAECEKIESLDFKAKCFGVLSKTSDQAILNCRSLDDVNAKDECWSQSALSQNQNALCQNINSAAKKIFCETSISVANKNMDACANLPAGDGTAERNACYYSYALINNDSRACEKIGAVSVFKKSCIDQFSLQTSYVKKFLLAGQWVKNLLFGKSAKAQASDPLLIPVGGVFLSGVFDIFTPTYLCGVVVSVAGPRPGTFVWQAPRIYDYFSQSIFHVGLNMLGLAKLANPGSQCGIPTLKMLGSSNPLIN